MRKVEKERVQRVQRSPKIQTKKTTRNLKSIDAAVLKELKKTWREKFRIDEYVNFKHFYSFNHQ